MIHAERLNVKRGLIFFFSSLLYALCQMLLSNIVMEDDLWKNFHIQLSAHYIVVFAMCVADYQLLLFLNKHLPYPKNIIYRIIAELTGLIAICFILLSVFNFLIYNVLLVPHEGMPSLLTKFALAMLTNTPILLVFELIHYFQSEQKAIADSEKAQREALLFEHETLKSQINPHFLFNSLNVLSSLIYFNPFNITLPPSSNAFFAASSTLPSYLPLSFGWLFVEPSATLVNVIVASILNEDAAFGSVFFMAFNKPPTLLPDFILTNSVDRI